MTAERRELQSWDAISGFLGITTRAAQEHERRHKLPVYRMPGTKGRVFAYTDELEQWKATGTSRWKVTGTSTPQAEPVSPRTHHGILGSANREVWFGVGVATLCLVAAAAAVSARYPQASKAGPPADWRLAGKVLKIVDAQGLERWSWRFDHHLPHRRDYPEVVFSDCDGDDKDDVLFVYFPVDEKTLEIPDGGAQLWCFGEDGKPLWQRKFGTAFTTPLGRTIPDARYQIRVLGRLKKPRADRGLIVAGGHRGGSLAFQVALYTSEGEQRGVYVHPGWVFSMVIVDLNSDGKEEIILGGVNGPYSEHGYGATIVVLDSSKLTGQWQGSVPKGYAPMAQGWEVGKEAAVVLIKEFAESPDNHLYCRVYDLKYGGGVLEVMVNKGDPNLPHAWFYFDRQLRLTTIQPELNFGSQLLRPLPHSASPAERSQFILKSLGNVKYLRNKFVTVQMAIGDGAN